MIALQEELRCYDGVPRSNAGKRILNVRVMYCDDSEGSSSSSEDYDFAGSSSGGSSAATNWLLALLIVLVTALLIVVLMRNNEKLKPALHNLQRSMQYRTIEKEEAPTEVNV